MVTIADGSSSGSTDLIRLKTDLHRQIIDLVDFSKAEALTEAELRAQLKALAEYLCSRQPIALSEQQREKLVLDLMDEIYGLRDTRAVCRFCAPDEVHSSAGRSSRSSN